MLHSGCQYNIKVIVKLTCLYEAIVIWYHEWHRNIDRCCVGNQKASTVWLNDFIIICMRMHESLPNSDITEAPLVEFAYQQSSTLLLYFPARLKYRARTWNKIPVPALPVLNTCRFARFTKTWTFCTKTCIIATTKLVSNKPTRIALYQFFWISGSEVKTGLPEDEGCV